MGNISGETLTLPPGTDIQQFCYDEQNRLTWAVLIPHECKLAIPLCRNMWQHVEWVWGSLRVCQRVISQERK